MVVHKLELNIFLGSSEHSLLRELLLGMGHCCTSGHHCTAKTPSSKNYWLLKASRIAKGKEIKVSELHEKWNDQLTATTVQR
jgi:hypothetical protein